MSLGVFSTAVPAKAVEEKLYHFVQSFTIWNEWQTWSGSSYPFTPDDGVLEFHQFVDNERVFVPYSTKIYTIRTNFAITSSDGSPIVKAGGTTEIRLYRANVNYLIYKEDGVDAYNERDITTVRALLQYADGSYSYIDEVNASYVNEQWNLNFSCTPAQDIISVEFIISTQDSVPSADGPWYISAYMGEQYGDNTFNFSVDQATVEEDLLGGIQEEITSGFDRIGGWFSDLGAGISNVFNSIVELPAKIWGFIEDGLKSLFVPSEESMTAYQDKWDTLLESRLGAVYQVTNVLTESWDGVMAADQTNTIDFPAVSIPLPGGSSFSFGGYEVQIVPTGFDVLVNGIKIIIGIICSIAFVNGMRKRYDEVMGVEQ